jgi:hypothetical protein
VPADRDAPALPVEEIERHFSVEKTMGRHKALL